MNDVPIPPLPPDLPTDWHDFDAQSEVMKLLNEAEPSYRTTVGPVGTVVVPEDPPTRKNRLWVVERLDLESLSWEPVPVFRRAVNDDSGPSWGTTFTTRAEAREVCKNLNHAFPAIDAYGKKIVCWRVRCYVAE